MRVSRAMKGRADWARILLLAAVIACIFPAMSLADSGTRTPPCALVAQAQEKPEADAAKAGPAGPAPADTSEVFRHERANVAITLGIICFLVLFFIVRSRRNPHLYIRRIAGLNAIDEALGRATEMGRSVLYVPGIMDVDRMETIASMAILGEVARKAATYATRLQVPTAYPLAMSTASEIVRAAYQEAGRPDLFRPEDVRFVTDNLFAYAGAVCGLMVRERPAANFFFGEFYAESLLLAETGNTTGAIQIAGTGRPFQLPFFIAACDYTLLGEELFAASAYLTRAPLLLGSLKGQDYAKLAIAATVLVGIVLELWGIHALRDALAVR